MTKPVAQLLALGLLAGAACLPSKAQAQMSNMCSYQAVTTPLTGTECFPINQNGVTKTATANSFFKQAVQGPNTSTIGDLAVWANATGTKLSDSGTAPTLSVGDTVALQALPTTVLAITNKVSVGTYKLPVNGSQGQYSPPVVYYLTNIACTPDGGSCFNAQGGLFWQITPQTVYDARWWGAYEDVQTGLAVTQTTNGSCGVTVTGFNFSSSDAGKYIVITDAAVAATPLNPNGPTYAGQIVTGSGTSVTVTPCVGFSTNQSQVVYYGHDDAAAWNNAISYVGSIANSTATTSLPQLNGSGNSSGVYSAPVNVNKNIYLENASFVALGSANFPLPGAGSTHNAGMFEWGSGGTLTRGSQITLDGAFLPIDVGFAANGANGTIFWDHVIVKDWLGNSPKTVSLSSVSTNTAAGVTGSISNCNTPIAPSTLYTCTMNVTGTIGVIQPGQAVTGSGVPDGTYVSQFGSGTGAGAGGVGNYFVVNNTSSPAVSSEALVLLSLDLNVTGGGAADIGLVSRGNSCVADRTIIVAYTANKVTLNKAPTCNHPNSMTLYQDSNGIYLSNQSGLHFTSLTLTQRAFSTIPGNHYGAALYDDASGGTSFDGATNIDFGITPILLGPDSQQNRFTASYASQNLSGQCSNCLELNSPALIAVDGAESVVLNDFQPDGQIQMFRITDTNAAILTANWVAPINSLLFGYYAPNNAIWVHTELANTTAQHISVSPFGYSQMPIGLATLTVGGSGSWTEYSAAQIAAFAPSRNTMLTPFNNSPMKLPQGLDLGTSAISENEELRNGVSGAYIFQETDSGSFITNSGSSATWTIPNTLNPTNVQNWHVKLINTTASTITVAAGSGTTLLQSGSSVASTALTENFEYELDCPINPNGTSVTCVISKLP